jgi:hypothetical protein
LYREFIADFGTSICDAQNSDDAATNSIAAAARYGDIIESGNF